MAKAPQTAKQAAAAAAAAAAARANMAAGNPNSPSFTGPPRPASQVVPPVGGTPQPPPGGGGGGGAGGGGGGRGANYNPRTLIVTVVNDQNEPITKPEAPEVFLHLNSGIHGTRYIMDLSSQNFIIANVPLGNHLIVITHKHYKKKEHTIKIHKNSPQEIGERIKLELSHYGKNELDYINEKEHIEDLVISHRAKAKKRKAAEIDYENKKKDAERKDKDEKGERSKTPEEEREEKHYDAYNMKGWRGIYRGPRNLSKLSQDWIEDKWGNHVMKVFNALIVIIAGLVISYFFEGNLGGYFTWGFMCLAAVTVFPKPHPIEKLGKNVILTYPVAAKLLFTGDKGMTFGALRSGLKFFAIVFLIWGAQNSTAIGFLGNIVMILVAAISYFSLSAEFDPSTPGMIFEPVAKFFIGLIIIPWWVFYGIFQSFILGLMAMAFFAVPPIATKSEEGEAAMRGELTRWLFLGIMVFTLFASGVFGDTSIWGMTTWGLTGAFKSTFLYFWLVTTIAGFFSPVQSRPAIGFIMLSVATMIYATGTDSGAQDVGSALLGPWFGKAFASITEIMAPVTDAFNQLGNTFGNAFQMIINPVGFAQGIMTGTYTQDTQTGLIGAYGLEVGNFHATPIYIGQPYSIIIPITNKGSADAERITVTLLAGTGVNLGKGRETVKNLPKERIGYWNPMMTSFAMLSTLGIAGDLTTIERKAMNIGDLGLTNFDTKMTQKCEIKKCVQDLGTRTLTKLDSEQVFFASNQYGIDCPAVVNYELLTQKASKFLPFSAIISYDYDVESSLEIEAISQDEWSRLAQEGMLFPGTKKSSSMKNSPAMLNIDTLEQPIREGTPFYIAFNLTPAIPGKSWIQNASVQLELPPILSERLIQCTTKPGTEIIDLETGTKTNAPDGTWVWNTRTEAQIKQGGEIPGTFPTMSHAIYCYFQGIPVLEGKPSDTYYIRAYSKFRFYDVTTKAFALEFGGLRCCDPNNKDDNGKYVDCPGENPICDAGTKRCNPGLSTTTYCTHETFGKNDYCATVKDSSSMKCKAGQGICTMGSDECNPAKTLNNQITPTICRDDLGTHKPICCPSGPANTPIALADGSMSTIKDVCVENFLAWCK